MRRAHYEESFRNLRLIGSESEGKLNCKIPENSTGYRTERSSPVVTITPGTTHMSRLRILYLKLYFVVVTTT